MSLEEQRVPVYTVHGSVMDNFKLLGYLQKPCALSKVWPFRTLFSDVLGVI